MTDEARNIALGAGVVLALLIASCELRAERPPPPGYYDEQLLDHRYSMFCATVPRPPLILDKLLSDMGPDNPQLKPAIDWWKVVVVAYREAGCRDG